MPELIRSLPGRPAGYTGPTKIIHTFVKCTPEKKCRGQLPYKIGDETVWLFVYWDGGPDSGVRVETHMVEINGEKYSWKETHRA